MNRSVENYKEIYMREPYGVTYGRFKIHTNCFRIEINYVP